MLSREDYLLLKLSEECAEVIKEVHKALEFGLYDFDPDKPNTNNREKIVQEFIECQTVFNMLVDEQALFYPNEAEVSIRIDAKQKKVEKYMEYSRNCGKLEQEGITDWGDDT